MIQVRGVEIILMPVEIGSGKVRLGFAAPEEVVIHRREVAEKIEQAANNEVPL